MELTEHWRLRLKELMAALQLKPAAFSREADIDASYLSRLLYEPGKPGRKNLGLKHMRAIVTRFELAPDWFDRPLGSALPLPLGPSPVVAKEPEPPYRIAPSAASTWPFKMVTFDRLRDLRAALGPTLAVEAFREIDNYLDLLVSRWERQAADTKSNHGA